MNGVYAGSVDAIGTAIYRDVSPGHYHISAESVGRDVNQTRDVDLAAGQEVFAKVLSLSTWESGGEQNQYQRDTFYVSLMQPQVAQAELATPR